MLFAGLLGGMVIVAEAEKALVAVLAAVGAGEEKIVEEEFFGAVSSGPVGVGATAVGAFWGLLDGKHGTNLFLAWSGKVYTKASRTARLPMEVTGKAQGCQFRGF